MYIEHHVETYTEVKRIRDRLKQIYGYYPEIFKVTDPFGNTFYLVVEPMEAIPLKNIR